MQVSTQAISANFSKFCAVQSQKHEKLEENPKKNTGSCMSWVGDGKSLDFFYGESLHMNKNNKVHQQLYFIRSSWLLIIIGLVGKQGFKLLRNKKKLIYNNNQQ